jgi:hypothetical protein
MIAGLRASALTWIDMAIRAAYRRGNPSLSSPHREGEQHAAPEVVAKSNQTRRDSVSTAPS